MKNNVDVFYFAILVPVHVLFTEDGALEKKVYLSTWSEIPQHSEYQTNITDVHSISGEYPHPGQYIRYILAYSLPSLSYT